MKKAYTKPYVLKESFQLDAAIAGSCTDENRLPLGHSRSSCRAQGGFFASALCDPNLSDFDFADGNDDICYHGPLVTGGAAFLAS